MIDYKVDVDPGKPTIVTYNAPLDYGIPPRYVRGKVNFNAWWGRRVVDDKQGNRLTRKTLLLTTCQQDGGAHVDAEIIENYVNALRTFPVLPTGPHGGGILSNIIYGSIRQITHEVLKSLKDEFPDYF